MPRIVLDVSERERREYDRIKGDRTDRGLVLPALGITPDERILGRPPRKLNMQTGFYENVGSGSDEADSGEMDLSAGLNLTDPLVRDLHRYDRPHASDALNNLFGTEDPRRRRREGEG